MALSRDWILEVPGAVGTQLIASGARLGLRNIFYNKFVQYGEREYGINLVWTSINGGDIRLSSQSGAALQYGEPVALYVEDGGYVHYQEREYGINLSWSNNPVYEWRLTGAPAGSPVSSLAQLGLLNDVSQNEIVACEREYGINLVWANDCNDAARKRNESHGPLSSIGDVISDAASAVAGAVTTGVNAVVDTLESSLGAVLDALAWGISAILSIPILGRAVEWAINIGTSLVWWFASLVDFVATLAGITIEKRMKVCVIIQRDEHGSEVTTTQTVLEHLTRAIEIFKRQANVRLLPAARFHYSTAFDPLPTATEKYVVVEAGPSDSDTLDVFCGGTAGLDDLGTVGMKFNWKMARYCFNGGFRRLAGYGAPVAAFAVRSFKDGHWGCSLGPLVDYVTVQFNKESPRGLAHEVAHACSLWHKDNKRNLMYPDPDRGETLTRLQKAVLRASPHVTFF